MQTIYKGKHIGNIEFAEGDDATNLTEVTGSLDVSPGATFDAAALTSIGGGASVRPGATFNAAALTSIGGGASVSPDATFDAAALTSIGGDVYVRPGATFNAAALTSIGGYKLPDKATARKRLIEVAKAALADPAKLNMSVWHDENRGCGTSHCIAGWAVHLAPDGYALEEKVGSTLLAGNILLGVEASKLFFLDNDSARSVLHKVLAEAGDAA